MNELLILPPAANYIKKIKDKKLKALFKKAIENIVCNPEIGERKKGDLSGVWGYDIFYNKTNYEIAYTVKEVNNKVIVIIMVGTSENFYKQLKNYWK